MITRQDIDEALEELEGAPKNFETAHKTATLLQLRALLPGGSASDISAVSNAAPPDIPADSEFLTLALAKDPAAVWMLMDEMMDATAVLLPRMYDAVLRRLREM